MKKGIIYLIALLLFSCDNKKEIQLAKANKSIVVSVEEHSPIYIFFKIEGKDTIADVNRKNAIVSTNWIFNIDKRLPLKLVIPELIKLQNKKTISIHKNEDVENYFSYINEVKKTMAFLPFTKVNYVIGKPKSGTSVYFCKNNTIFVDNIAVTRDSLKIFLNKMEESKCNNINFCFDKNDTYNNYIDNVILVRSLEIESITPVEFIY